MIAPHAFQPKLDTLPQPQRALWHELAPTASLGFVLYGGTAVALRAGHRASVDFDFFSEQALLKVILQRVEAKDYVDIAAMLDASTALATGLAAAKALFGTAFQSSESLKALTWFEGGDLDALPGPTRTALTRAAAAVRGLPDVSIASRQLATTTT